jgi:Pilus formation protein N terminal region
MAALYTRGWAKAGPLCWVVAALFSIALSAPVAAAAPPPPESIVVHLDQARILHLPDRAVTVVVGNPLIADLSIQPGGLAVITGKAYGATNFIVMDKSGDVLTEKTIEVAGPGDNIVVVYSGQTRQTYSCTPDCSPRITLGDTGIKDFDKDTQLYNDFFTGAMTQAVTRNLQASGAGALSSGH